MDLKDTNELASEIFCDWWRLRERIEEPRVIPRFLDWKIVWMSHSSLISATSEKDCAPYKGETSKMSPVMTQDLWGSLQITVQNRPFPADHEGLKVLKRWVDVDQRLRELRFLKLITWRTGEEGAILRKALRICISFPWTSSWVINYVHTGWDSTG